ncbi:MAG: DUF2169 domain-containing protein [Myxococcota bacterium]
MFQLVNDTPFPSQLGLFTDHEGHSTASVVLKATLAIAANDGICRPAPRQLPVLHASTYVGEVGRSSIRYPADLVPIKPRTDVVFVGHAYTPGRRALTEIAAYLEVGAVRKTMTVVGDRQWVRTRLGAVMSRPVPFVRMPIIYERAYGGQPPSQWDRDDPGLDPRNPVGTGYCATRSDVHQMPLPNLEDPGDRIQSWRQRPPVVGLGAVDAHWMPRRQRAGTYDRTWRAQRCPILPRDFDPRFHCVAGEGLQSSAPMRGELGVTLVHLAVQPVLRFRLPGTRVGMDFHVEGDLVQRRAQLWTVVIEPDELRVMMVWGASCWIGKRPAGLHQVELEVEWA